MVAGEAAAEEWHLSKNNALLRAADMNFNLKKFVEVRSTRAVREPIIYT